MECEPQDLRTRLNNISPKLDLSEHLARFTAVGLEAHALLAIAQWTRIEISDTLTRLLARRSINTPGLSPFQGIVLEHGLRSQRIEPAGYNAAPLIATLTGFLAHPMPGVALEHRQGLFLDRGVRHLADIEKLYELEDWVDVLHTRFGGEEGLTSFEMIVLEKGICRLRERQD
ncbi:hypothetical protein C8F01DRAFT_1248079 [Mycena amicta]|nr:hypothetical protein C8F01DRAFT_1248079 [Mycena amicta]